MAMTLGQDLRSSMRMMTRAPGFAAAAVATLALGLGLNSAALSFAYALFLKPLPVNEARRLVVVDQTAVGDARRGFPLSYPDYAYYRDHARSFSDLAAQYPTSPMFVAARGNRFGLSGAVVTANYFSTLRLQPAFGRFFTDEEDRVPGRNPVVVISHDLWRTRFDADTAILGASLTINGTAFTIVGVSPDGFHGTEAGLEPNEVWIPSSMLKMGYRYCDGFARTCRILTLLGRLAPRTTIDEAQSEMTVLARQLETQFPETNRDRGVSVRPARGVRVMEQERDAPIVALLAGAAALVLLVASANVAGLLLARGLRRRKEIAIRMALGAGRWRLVRQLLVESSVLAGVGGIAGLLVALWATEMLRRFFGVASSGDALNVDFSILDPGIVAAGLVVALGAGIVTGVVPALQTTRRDTLPALKDETAGSTLRRSHLRDGLIVLQLAVSVLLLIASGLLIRSFFMLHRGPGFDPDSVVLTRLRPSLVSYTPERAWAYHREVIRRLEALPGVVAASPGRVPHLPRWARTVLPIQLPGDSGDPARAFRTPTTPVGSRYFRMLGVDVLEGREFDDRDTASSPRVTIVNETLAQRLWPNGHPVGTTVTINGLPHEVIGVVNDLQIVSVLQTKEPIAYLDFWQQDPRNVIALDSQTHVRVQGDATALLPLIRRTIAEVDPDVPSAIPQTLGAAVDFQFKNVRGARALLMTFGVLALVVSAIGLYATLAFSVGQRTREIAIRMALGAARADVGRLVFRHGGALVLLGVVVGVVAAVFGGPLLAHLLYGVSPYDPVVLFVAPLLLGTVALLATWLPARRAIAIEPIKALRAE
jgi:putative ABC transport system permease protein